MTLEVRVEANSVQTGRKAASGGVPGELTTISVQTELRIAAHIVSFQAVVLSGDIAELYASFRTRLNVQRSTAEHFSSWVSKGSQMMANSKIF